MMIDVLKTIAYVFNKEENVKNFVAVLNNARLGNIMIYLYRSNGCACF